MITAPPPTHHLMTLLIPSQLVSDVKLDAVEMPLKPAQQLTGEYAPNKDYEVRRTYSRPTEDLLIR